MRVVVTGGTGFIGAATVAELERRGHQAIVFDRTRGDNILTDTPPSADHVIHLAGILGTDELFDNPHQAVDINVNGTINVLRWCRDHRAGYTGITQPDVFPSVYTATRICATHMARAWHHTYGVPVSFVRAYNAFGPRQHHGPGHPRKIIPAFATEAHRGVPVVVWGDGEQTVDLVHVNDVARMLVDATTFGAGQMFDAGTGVAMTVNEAAHMVIDLARSTSPLEHRPMRRGETPTAIVADGQGWELLDWKPEFRHDDLAATVEWYRPT